MNQTRGNTPPKRNTTPPIVRNQVRVENTGPVTNDSCLTYQYPWLTTCVSWYSPTGNRSKVIISRRPICSDQKTFRISFSFQADFWNKCWQQNSIPPIATFPFTPNMAA